MQKTVILSAARTPIGAFLGSFKDVPATKLGAIAVAEAVRRAKIPTDAVEECLMGCVLPAGLGQAPARQAAIYAELPKSVRCTTINRVCGSGLKSVMLASQGIQTGDIELAVAGGMESMSRAPYLLTSAREGYRLGHQKVVDSMILDGLWDAYGDKHMGEFAELCARERKVDRAEQDEYAKQSYIRAVNAIQKGFFKEEIVAVSAKVGKEQKDVDTDEEPFRAKLDKFGELKPAFQKDGTITAANASSLSDGASALVLGSDALAKKLALKPIARLVGQASFAHAPEWFTTAPVGAIKRLLEKTGLKVTDIDLFEINEAFSVVTLACVKELNIPQDKVNIWGGAVALGHPIGASGARILTTLIHALRATGKSRGIATLCIGGGEASAVLVEVEG